MGVKDLILATRTIRRYDAGAQVSRETLLDIVDCGRLGASGGNKQPLKFLCVNDPEKRAAVFSNLAFAAYFKDWTPPPHERPGGYVIILGDTDIATNFWCDHGIAAQNMLLRTTELGLGGCILAAINKNGLRKAFAIPERFEILLVIALGTPAETVVLTPMGEDGDVRYWRDDAGVHHVPKRGLDEVVLAVNPPLAQNEG